MDIVWGIIDPREKMINDIPAMTQTDVLVSSPLKLYSG